MHASAPTTAEMETVAVAGELVAGATDRVGAVTTLVVTARRADADDTQVALATRALQATAPTTAEMETVAVVTKMVVIATDLVAAATGPGTVTTAPSAAGTKSVGAAME